MNNENNYIDFVLTINPDADEPIMLLDDEIGFNPFTYTGISGAQFTKELLYLDSIGKKKIKVYINSIGGNVIDGMSIFNAILSSKASVDTYCTGIAASIAGVIFLAGKKRYIADYGLLMTHNPYTEDGDGGEFLERIRESLITMIAARTGISSEDISDLMDRETWMDADEARRIGFANDVITSGDNNVKRINKQEDIKQKYQECKLIMNKVFDLKNNKTNMELNKINKELGIDETSTIDNVLIEIKNLKSKLSKVKNSAESEDESGEALDKMTNAYNDMKSKYDECMNELGELKDKMEETEVSNKKEKALDMVNNFVKMGKIKNDASAIEKWLAIAEGDYEIAKSLIEELPINKSAVGIPTKNAPEVPVGYNAVALKMQELRNKLEKK